jgi:putative transposase
VQTGVGPVPVRVPRDRNGSFEPLLLPKRSGRIAGGLDDMVISLYAHGMSVRDVIHHLRQVYGNGLTGFADAIRSAFPATVVQRCVVHLVRNALRPVARRDAGQVAAGLRKVYAAKDAGAALDALADFSASEWGIRYPQAAKVFEDAWDDFTPFLAFGPATRKLLYTTNSIESLNYQLRKVTKARGHFPAGESVVKLLWLAIINIEDKRARERLARRAGTGKRSGQPAKLIEGQRVMGWRDALNELDQAYPRRLRQV